MTEYKMIPLAESASYTSRELIQLFNEAVETIWNLQHKYHQLNEDYEKLLADYETVTTQLYG